MRIRPVRGDDRRRSGPAEATWHLLLVSLAMLLFTAPAAPAGPPGGALRDLPRLPILMYHRISNRTEPGDGGRVLPLDDFEEQLRYLRGAGYTSLHFSDYLAIREGRRACPRRPVILTFDDGYDDNFSEAYPLLRAHGLEGVFFPVVGAVGHSGHITWRKWRRIDPAVIEVGCHTMNHASLAGLSPRRMERELVESRDVLEGFFLRPVVAFAFPYGSYDEFAVRSVARAGYRVAVTSDPGVNRFEDDPLRLKRIHVIRGMSLERLARLMGGPAPAAPSD